jgi:hypothetical protein
MANIDKKDLGQSKYWPVFLEKVRNNVPFSTSVGSPVVIDSTDTRWSGVDTFQEFYALFRQGASMVVPTSKPRGTILVTKLLKDNIKASGTSGGADAKTTAVQERGSAYILQRVLKNNKRYNSANDIRKDTQAYRALLTIWRKEGIDFEEGWLDDYYKQQKTMLVEYSNPRFTQFIRDGGFMDWITKLVKTKYQISKKDNWNPADIWLIKDQNKTIKMIQGLIDGGSSQTLEELNAILRQLFHDDIVVGVSLKKISGKEAYYERVNLSKADFESYKQMYYEISSIKCDLSLGKDKKGRTSFGTQDSRIFVDSETTTYNFQIKANDSAGFSNLKWEPTAKGQAAARLGKAPVDMVQKLLIDYRVRYDNKNGQYPKSLTDLTKVQDEYARIIKTLRQKGVETEVDEDAAINNIIVVLGNPETAHVANSKLMQLKFLHMLVGMQPVERNKFMTDMTFLAQKKGERFGPFGKLY